MHTLSVTPGPFISIHNPASPTTPTSFSQNVSVTNNSLVEVMDVLNRSMTNQCTVLQETLRQSQSSSKEHYLSNAQSCNGKDLKEFGMWLNKVSRLATICDKNPMKVALAISKGSLHKYINKLVSSGMRWLPIKAQLQERFLECGSATMAKHKLTQLKQLDLLMYEYIAKFGDMAEHACSIKPTMVQVTFWPQISLRDVKNKLRSYQIKNLKEIFGHTIHEDQKQKIRVLDFGVNSKPRSILMD